ncbi:hypothetical protein F4801DRAFT_556786 [Xylaria longipes]|nr:hypothetical protein F4801DRAFT_556786 [Xylaria longipes]
MIRRLPKFFRRAIADIRSVSLLAVLAIRAYAAISQNKSGLSHGSTSEINKLALRSVRSPTFGPHPSRSSFIACNEYLYHSLISSHRVW